MITLLKDIIKFVVWAAVPVFEGWALFSVYFYLEPFRKSNLLIHMIIDFTFIIVFVFTILVTFTFLFRMFWKEDALIADEYMG